MRLKLALTLAPSLLLWLACKDFGDQPRVPDAAMLSVVNAIAVEGQPIRIIVTLGRPLDSAVTFDYTTSDGTATAGSDYTAASGSDTISAGATKDTIAIATIDDAIPEPAETFNVTLSNLSRAGFADSVAVATITDNDGALVVSFAVDVQPILAGRCAIGGCHGTGSSSGGLTMGSASWTEIRNASGLHGAIVVAGNSSASNLYLKTTNQPPFGAQMPAVGTLLSLSQQQILRDWIDQGALNN